MGSDKQEGKFFIYYLRDNPQTTSTDFTNGLHGAFNGLEIEILENRIRKYPGKVFGKKSKSREHTVNAKVTDGEMIEVKLGSQTCQSEFKNGKITLTYQDQELTLYFQQEGTDKRRECLSFRTDQLDFNGYFFLAAYSGNGAQDSEHIIRSIKTFNLDKPTTGDDADIYWD